MSGKIVLIGAGSVKFTQGLIADLINSRQPWRLGLVDIDPQALEVATGLAEKMVQAKGAEITVASSTDRNDLLPGADVVVSTVGVGGRRAWEADVFIPRQYGVFQSVGDTAMAGGISRAMRMIPAMVDIAADVVRQCPTAHFFNYANPMTVNCWAMRQVTGANVVGLCIGVYNVQQRLVQALGVPWAEVTSLAAGLNHFTWIYDLRQNGRNLWPLVRERIAQGADEGELANGFCKALFGVYGAFPAVGDAHVMEFFPERFPNGLCYGRPLGQPGHFEAIISQDDATFEQMKRIACGEEPLDERLFRGSTWEHAQLLDILRAMEHDSRQVFTANVPNRGIIPNLPAEAIVEVSAVATARGLRPLPIPDFSDRLAAPLWRKLAAQALTVEAALSGDRRLFVEALLADGCVREQSVAERLADELLAAHRAYLPQFA